MVPELMRDFNADAAQIGLMVAFYLYAYAPMQLIVGIFMDYYGAKRLLTFAATICGLGAIFFGVTSSLWLASIGRLFMGAGSAFAFVGMVFVCSHFFPKKKRALVIGLANSIGMLGAVAGGGPLSVVIHKINWRIALETLGFIGLVLALFIFLFYVKEDKIIQPKESKFKLLGAFILQVCKNPYSWLNSIVASLFYLTTTVFGGLWGISFLQSAYGFSAQVSSFAMSMIFVGWLVGGPVTGLISDLFKKRQAIISFSIALTCICLCIVLFVPNLPLYVIYALLLLIGIFSSAELLHFSYAIEITTVKIKGTAVAFTNGMISFLESAVQPLVGFLLVLSWNGNQINGAPVYQPSDYRQALTILPICLVIAFILSFFLKERRYKESATPHSSFVENT